MISRRVITSGLVASPFLLNRTLRAQTQADVDVAIIGAGAAGIVAGQAARKAGLTARLFEARPRVGGRVFTDASLGPAFDAGAFYIHFAERNPWRQIAETLGVPIVDDNTLWGGFEVFRDGKPLPPDERGRRRGAFGRLANAVDTESAGSDLSFADAARQLAPDLMDSARNLTLLSLGEEPERASIKDYQRLDAGDDYVVPSGYGNLLTRHAEGLDITLATPVTAIDWSGPGVILDTAKGRIRARAAVITVPVNVLKSGAIRFTPDLPASKLGALDGLGMGALTKVALHMEGTRFGLSPWTQFFDQGQSGASASPSDLVNFEFWPFDRPLVVAMFGGDFARDLVRAGEAEAIRIIHARLVAILGADAQKAFRGGRLAGWSAEPYSLGCYSIAKPGQSAARDALAEPVANRLLFAGEASAGDASMTAGGAALAGEKAIGQIAALLKAK